MSREGGRAIGAMPAGVTLSALSGVRDQRGHLVEVHRARVPSGGPRPVQWNALVSSANTLRGMHVHVEHTDWVAVLDGAAVFHLVDLRGGPDAPLPPALAIELDGDASTMLVIPPGVLHGIYTPDHSVLLNGLSHGYDPNDDVAVRYDDPALGIDWGPIDPVLSARDRDAGNLASLFAGLAARRTPLPSLPA